MEIPEKPKCSNIEENYPTDHIRPAEVMDENDPPVYVKSELKQSNYVQQLGVVEEYVPIVWDELKVETEVYDTNKRKKGIVFKKNQETEEVKFIVGVSFGENDAKFYTGYDMEKYLRLVVKPTDVRHSQVDDMVLRPHHIPKQEIPTELKEQKIELTYPELIFTGKQIKDLAKDLTDTGEVRLSISGIKIIKQ